MFRQDSDKFIRARKVNRKLNVMSMQHSPQKNPTVMTDVKVLVHLRGQARAKVTRIKKVLEEECGASRYQLKFAQLKVYARNLETHYQEYLSLHHQITSLIPLEKQDEQDDVYLQFENLHIETSSMLEDMMGNHEAARPCAQQIMTQPQVIVQQQPLPVPIPTFDGKPENWPRFKQTFLDIMSRSRDSDAVKLHHLEKALVGAAANIIDPKTLSDSNYAHAWELLLEMFEDERKIVDSHIHCLLHLKRMTKECPQQLRDLVKEVTRNIERLKISKQDLSGVSERFVVYLIASALDMETKKQWESTIPHKNIPSYEDTISFLKQRCSLLERCEVSVVKQKETSTFQKQPSKNVPAFRSFAAAAPAASSRLPVCEFCSGSHLNFRCESFRSLAVPQRRAKVRELHLCYNCLRKGHTIVKCPSERFCQECHAKHHSLLHDNAALKIPENNSNREKNLPIISSPIENVTPFSSVPVSNCSIGKVSCFNNTLLLTAVVDIIDKHGNPQLCRAILDCGSQPNLISRRMVDKLDVDQLPGKTEAIGVSGKRTILNRNVNLTLHSRRFEYQCQLECLVTDTITGILPNKRYDIRNWKIPPGLQLADESFNTPGEVDLLIGVKLFFQLMLPGQLTIGIGLPILKETKLGWVVAGAIEDVDTDPSPQHCFSSTVQSLEECIQRFWTTESIESDEILTNEEQECENIFQSTTKRDLNGHYIVMLPLKDNIRLLQNNRSLALKRFHMLEHRFQRNVELKKLYVDFINEYKELSHCIEVFGKNDEPTRLSAPSCGFKTNQLHN